MKNLRIAEIVFICLLVAGFTIAAPTGPTNLTALTSSRYSVLAASNTSAVAGNVTELSISANTVTNTWQGYYGNVSGTIFLGNSGGDVMYNWTLAAAQGEIYATRTEAVPTWASIRCANATEITAENTALNVPGTAVDGVDDTFFNTTDFSVFYVGAVDINQTEQDCYATNLYNATGAQTTYFSEVLLSDTTQFIYTGLLDNNANGFDDSPHDFQMLVGEDGHNGNAAPTTYFFYVELE